MMVILRNVLKDNVFDIFSLPVFDLHKFVSYNLLLTCFHFNGLRATHFTVYFSRSLQDILQL